MPSSTFFELESGKRQRIVDICTAEFAEHGYENASTNRIIEKSGISKGSLFKYFENKEALYLYILDLAANEMLADLSERSQRLSSDIFKMAVEYSSLEFAWYAEHPEKARIIIAAFTKSDTEIYRKVTRKYSGKDEDIYYTLFKNVDDSQFVYSKQKTLDIFKWFMKGFNDEFCEKIRFGTAEEIGAVKNEYTNRLAEHTEILRAALMR